MNALCEENTKPVAGEGMCPTMFCVREQGIRMEGATGGRARLGPLTSSLTTSPLSLWVSVFSSEKMNLGIRE